MRLSQVGEFELIRRFTRLENRFFQKKPGVVLGPGDDAAAVVATKKNRLLLLTCDPVIEGIHFDSSATPYQIGWKAMARNLSDIAAMGGKPLYAVASASFTKKTDSAVAVGICRGLAAAGRRYGTVIVGGDTSHNDHGIHLVVTVVGEVKPSRMTTRSGARPGDLLCVTGKLGGSLLGKHLRFQPRLAEGQFLAEKFHPSAMMDLSDGLASDLKRLSEQSKVGFEVWADKIPVSTALKEQKGSRKEKICRALRDGEDYELLFTLAPHRFEKLRKEWKKNFRILLTPIGRVRPSGFGIRLLEKEDEVQSLPIFTRTNDHFQNEPHSL